MICPYRFHCLFTIGSLLFHAFFLCFDDVIEPNGPSDPSAAKVARNLPCPSWGNLPILWCKNAKHYSKKNEVIQHTASYKVFSLIYYIYIYKIIPGSSWGLVFWTLRQNLPFCVRGVLDILSICSFAISFPVVWLERYTKHIERPEKQSYFQQIDHHGSQGSHPSPLPLTACQALFCFSEAAISMPHSGDYALYQKATGLQNSSNKVASCQYLIIEPKNIIRTGMNYFVCRDFIW